MKNRVPKKTAAERKAHIEERQVPITEERMNRFVGRKLEVLLEEELAEGVSGSKDDASPAAGLWLGRLYCQGPEVDGAAVVHTGSAGAAGGLSGTDAGTVGTASSLRPGTMVRGTVSARTGFDLQIRAGQ
jgi:ribosomal protein S12 methylthiotransferase